MKFEVGDIIHAGYAIDESFATRQIIGTDKKYGKYVTRFLEEGSVVESPVAVIDSRYCLV